MASGIYIACNSAGQVVYVGMTSNSATRWSKHRVPLRGGYHPNKFLQDAWNESSTGLRFVMIEHGKANLAARERIWINYFSPVANRDVLETTAGQRTRLRNLTNNPTARKRVILANGKRFSSVTAFAKACGFAQAAAVTNALARGQTFDQIARRKGLL